MIAIAFKEQRIIITVRTMIMITCYPEYNTTMIKTIRVLMFMMTKIIAVMIIVTMITVAILIMIMMTVVQQRI